ncbi:hypothetical protein HY947_00315, partial [Candidatus Gottesmanbacteria bacterium]|nr:hypothetical protein [Candidatus Gottesmanbacteria bacterium]
MKTYGIILIFALVFLILLPSIQKTQAACFTAAKGNYTISTTCTVAAD